MLGEHADFLRQRAPQVNYSARILYQELSRGRGYRGSYDTVKRFVQPLREVAVQAERVLTRFETPPGWQSQVDWGQGRVYFGQRAVVQHFFVLTLGYSRRGFYCAYPDEKLGCFLEAHERAFEHFGGHTDGVMIVSQADWYKSAQPPQRMIELTRGHGRAFLHACERTVSAGRGRLAHYRFPLAIGCGIASGELDRVSLFGRFDFIGPAANEAAKLQQHAWNEICVTREFGAVLNLDGRSLDAEWDLATKGWRLRSVT